MNITESGQSSSIHNSNREIDEQFFFINSDPQKHIIRSDKSSSQKDVNHQLSQLSYIFLQDPKFRLGQGSYGSVYKCYTITPDKKIYRFALKIIKIPSNQNNIMSSQDMVDTTRQEIKTLLKLKHNINIIKIQDISREGNTIYLVLEYCNGKDIISYFKQLRLKSSGGIESIQRINYFFAQLLHGFQDLNMNNIIHRDIKPGNILVSDGILKIADFGLSKPIFQKSQKIDEYVGTPCTAAPQIRFKQDYTQKCDIFSLGVVYYWMIYGKYPMKDNLPKQQYLQIEIQYPNVSVDNYIVTEDVKELIKQMLAYEQKDRINWKELYSHPFFQQGLRNIKLTSGKRNTLLDRNLSIMKSDDFNQKIPEEIHKYLKEEDYRMNRMSFEQYEDWIAIIRSVRNFTLKIQFFKELLKELDQFQVHLNSEDKVEQETIRDLIRLGLQNYIIYLTKRLGRQITFKDVPTILHYKALNSLQKQDKFISYSKDIISQIQAFEESQQRPKLSTQGIKKLKIRAKSFEIYQQFESLFETSVFNESQVLNQIYKCIIEMIFYLKPEIKNFNSKKAINKTSIEKNRFKVLIVLAHHLNMFMMHTEIFTPAASQNYQMEIQDFIQGQKFGNQQAFNILSRQILFLIDRFEE